MNPIYDEVKDLVLALLGHDRWNTSLSDERLAERIAVTLDGRGALFAPQRAGQSSRS
jgi:hypothetical protein